MWGIIRSRALGLGFLLILGVSSPVQATQSPDPCLRALEPEISLTAPAIDPRRGYAMVDRDLMKALFPSFVLQKNDEGCSLAGATTAINWLRQQAGAALLEQDTVLDLAASVDWRKAVSAGGDGMSLSELGELLREALPRFSLPGREVRMIPVAGRVGEVELRAALGELERGEKGVILTNFDQSRLLRIVSEGHFSTLGAYDRSADAVLVLDVDYSIHPYWVTVRSLLDGMSGRGFIWIR